MRFVAEATSALHLTVAGRFIEARTRGEHAVRCHARPPSCQRRKQGTLLRDAYLGLARAYAALGLPEQARDAFAHARALYAEIGHHMMLGVTLLTELDQAVIPYYADLVSERRRIAAEAEAAYAKASTAAPDQPPRIARVHRCSSWKAIGPRHDRCSEAMPRPLEPFPSLLRATIAARQGDVGLAWQLVREDFPDGPETRREIVTSCHRIGLQRLAAVLALDAGDRSTRGCGWRRTTVGWLGAAPSLGPSEGQRLWAQYYRSPATRTGAEHAGAPSPSRPTRDSRSRCSPPSGCSANSIPTHAGMMRLRAILMSRCVSLRTAPRRTSGP